MAVGYSFPFPSSFSFFKWAFFLFIKPDLFLGLSFCNVGRTRGFPRERREERRRRDGSFC
ncbi:hypothetical protein Goari_026522 [Gossypium aridum]|uniref:Uncharacterized protein n=1 Tax=Gossypium aridum TaxID=34290 RepID=A0A7J8XCC4_GOSAI|nr:hypothetical protein [Gossypium aridum]